jgi:hypothetical protein
MKAKLLKKMTVNGVDHLAGEILDVSGWRNTAALISMRYLSLVPDDVKPVKAEVKEIEIEDEKPVKAKSSVKK